MRLSFLMVVGVVLALPGFGWADEPKTTGDGRVAAGEYVEVGADGKANTGFTITAVEATPNILLLRGKHGWVTFATYDEGKKEYRGSFEFPRVDGRGPGGKWADLYSVSVTVRDGVLKVEGKSDKNEMVIRAKPAEPLPKR